MTFGPYAKTKDSGYPWLGEIPAHWDVRRLKRMCDINPSKRDIGNLDSQTLVSFLPMELIGDDGSVQLVDTRVVEEVQKGYTYFQDGDVLVAKITPCFENGKGALVQGLVNGIGFGTTELHVLRPRDSLDPRFLWYITASYGFRHTGTAMMEGAAGQKRVPERFVKDFPIAIPPKEEQKTIVRFLDGSLKSISDALAKSRRMIELLHNYRQALITQAVTRGLDPNVPMKDSGIPWLGVIPEHWRVVKLKRIAAIRYGLSQPPRELEGGVPFIRATNVSRGKIIPSDLMYVDPADVPREKKPVLQENEIIVVRSGAYTGDSAIVAHEYIGAIAGYDMVVSVTGANPHYVAYCLLSDMVLVNQIYVHRMRAAQPHLNAEELGDCLICLPSESEQSQIASFLRDRLGSVNALMSEMEVLSSVLSEYRQALITAAVTGKIDVRLEVQEHAG